MPDQVPAAIREERNQRLLQLVNEVAGRRYEMLRGRRMEILVEGPSKRNPERLSGRTRGLSPRSSLAGAGARVAGRPLAAVGVGGAGAHHRALHLVEQNRPDRNSFFAGQTVFAKLCAALQDLLSTQPIEHGMFMIAIDILA